VRRGRRDPRRKSWRCPHCGAYGWADSPDAARDAGIQHFIDEHDPKEARHA
jgi:uncharacterized protein with PIN domain